MYKVEESVPDWVRRELVTRELSAQTVQAMLERGCAGEPWEYILGAIVFYGCPIRTDKRALIPRLETELLVDLIVTEQPVGVVWDLCTGSGCIGIALKKHLSHLDVALSDISSDALSLASENCRLNGLDLPLYQGDLLIPFHGKRADLVVCNPPYISETEYPLLDSSVRAFEPQQALVAQNLGLQFYFRLSKELPLFLNPGATLFLEIGHLQGQRVSEIFSTSDWHGQRVMKDWSGKDRFFRVRAIL